MIAYYSTGPTVIVFFLSPTPLATRFLSTPNIFLFRLIYCFLMVACVAVRVDMVRLSPVVLLAIFDIESSLSCSFCVFPSNVYMSLFSWYSNNFALDWYSCRYWWEVMKYVLKLSRDFCADGFLLQSLQSSLNMPLLKTRLYADDIICYG